MSALPAVTSGAAPAVTMQDLEVEHAELLPARETLYSWSGGAEVHRRPHIGVESRSRRPHDVGSADVHRRLLAVSGTARPCKASFRPR
jgi:hypothetical protein